MEGPEIKFAEVEIDNGIHGKRHVRFETGRLAKQANGSVLVTIDDETTLLSATVVGKSPREGFDFFPLTVDVEERMYAAGKIPASYFRREGRPSTEAILAARLIDRPLRPAFTKGIRNEVQVVVTVLTYNPDEIYNTFAINAASASTSLSGAPFNGPIGGVRMALIDGQWVCFPKYSQLENAVFDMAVAGRIVTKADGTEDVAIMMVEAEATDNSWKLIKEDGQTAPTEEVVAQGLEAAKPFIDVVKSALAIIQKILWWIIRLAPLGTVGLIAKAVFAYGWASMGSLVAFVIALYIGLLLVFLVVYPLIVRANGLSVRQYFSGVWPALQLGFVSRSSMGSMPMTQTVAERNLGVPRAYASFAVPLGATTKMDGCASVYPALAAIFVAQFYGIQLDFTQYLLIVMVSVLGSAATAGTTGAIVMLTLTLSTLGLPLDGVGLLLAIDPIVDMGRTALNVAGQALVPAIVARREGILDEELYNAPRSEGGFVAQDFYDERIAGEAQRLHEVEDTAAAHR